MNESPLYLGFSRSTGGFFSRALGWLIRRFTGGAVNHAFLAWRDENLGWLTLGANVNGVTLMTMEKFLADRQIVALYLPRAGSLWKGLAECKRMIDEGYDFTGIPGIGTSLLVYRWTGILLPNWLSRRNRIFCSAFTAEVLRRSQVPANKRTAQFLARPDNLVAPAPLNAFLARDPFFAPFVWAGAPVPVQDGEELAG